MPSVIEVKQGKDYVTIEPIYADGEISGALLDGELEPWYSTDAGLSYLYSLVDDANRSAKENEEYVDWE